MGVDMSLQTRKELTASVKLKYSKASWQEKRELLNGFVAATGYQRKYAIRLLRSTQPPPAAKKKRGRKQKYGQDVKDALFTCYRVANHICPKRLMPFIEDLIIVLKKHGHISLSLKVETQLLRMSSATAERIIRTEREKQGKGLSTTKPGSLLKKQIQVRTFADWVDVKPGFMEADLVAHCGGNTHGSFLNTLTLTDIFSGWTEPLAILCKSSANVISSLDIAQEILPFKLLGLDTDNGSEFINYDLLDYCKEKEITFTRSRTYRKNDQAHVEEKNGSIIRKMVGYDRFEGIDAWQALIELYSSLRLYVNYFQPSLKLLSKSRNGSHVTKRYDRAKTPCQRLLESKEFSVRDKDKLKKTYEKLDPVKLLENINKCQNKFWQYAWSNGSIPPRSENVVTGDNGSTTNSNTVDNISAVKDKIGLQVSNRNYRQTRKPDKRSEPRTWKTRADPFEDDWDKIKLRLETDPNVTAASLLDWLIKDNPAKYNDGLLRTLQRRVKEWKVEWSRTIHSNFNHVS